MLIENTLLKFFAATADLLNTYTLEQLFSSFSAYSVTAADLIQHETPFKTLQDLGIQGASGSGSFDKPSVQAWG